YHQPCLMTIKIKDEKRFFTLNFSVRDRILAQKLKTLSLPVKNKHTHSARSAGVLFLLRCLALSVIEMPKIFIHFKIFRIPLPT
ncbi:MAG: hypothetical protein KBD41_09970, partial [Saprospiraceae bacterium]|nr:hypothetical protein [Saprospiraceae bacterium]